MVDLLGAGLVSLADLPESAAGGRALNLHMNRLRSTRGLRRFAKLEELILSANSISEIQDLDGLARLRVLDLSCNELRRLSGLAGLVALEELRLAYNRIETLEGLQQLWGRRYCLRALDLRQNRVAELPQLLFVGGCTELQDLRLQERGEAAPGGGPETLGRGSQPAGVNPVCAEGGYRDAVLQAVPWLCRLDDEPVSPRERERAARPGPPGPVVQPPLSEEEEEDDEEPEPPSDPPVPEREGPLECEGPDVQEEPEEGDGALPPELLELASRMTGLAQELALLRAPAGPPPEAVQRLQGEVLAELSALRRAEGSEELLQQEERAQEQRDASLRADLAEVALHMQRREEQHRATEQELARAEDAVAAVGAARAREVEVLEEAELRQAELEAHLSQEVAVEASARSAALSAEAALERTEVEQEAHDARGPGADAPQLQRELERARAALSAARQRLQLQEASLPKLSAAMSQGEARLSSAVASLTALRMRAKRTEAEARAQGQEAAEEAARLAAAVAEAAPRAQRQQAAVAEEAASALQLRAGLERVRAEAAECEQEASELLRPGQLNDIAREVSEEHLQAERSLSQRSERCTALRQRLQAALVEAEDAVAGGRQRLGLAEQRLAQQQAAARMADEQDGLARYILAELSLEVQQARASEQAQWRLNEDLAQQSAREEQTAKRFEEAALAAQREAEQVRASTERDHVPLALHAQCLGQSQRVQGAVEVLAERAREGQEAMEEGSEQLLRRREELVELQEALAVARRRELELEQNIRLKGHMAADKRAHMESVRLAMKRAEASQKEVHCALHSRLSEAAALADEHRELAEQLGIVAEEEREECCQWEQAVERKDEMAHFTEDQLQQLRSAQDVRVEQARSQARFLQSESRRLLDEARGHAMEMERRFREEQRNQERDQAALRSELAVARRRLQEWPEELRRARARMAREKAESAQRVAALLAGLRG